MTKCAVFGCKNYARITKNVKYFSLPKEKDLQTEWMIACQIKDKITSKKYRICSEHFEDRYFEIPLKQKLMNYTPKNARNLRDDAVPTLNLPVLSLSYSVRKHELEEEMLMTSASTSTCVLENHYNEETTEPQLVKILPKIEQKSPVLAKIKSEHGLEEEILMTSASTSTCVLENHNNQETTEPELIRILPKIEEKSPALAKIKSEYELKEEILMISSSTSTSVLENHNNQETTEPQIITTLPNIEQQHTEKDHQTELDGLREKINILESKNKKLLSQIQETKATAQKYKDMLERVFTPTQIKKLSCSKDNERIHCSSEDMDSYIVLLPRDHRRPTVQILQQDSPGVNWTQQDSTGISRTRQDHNTPETRQARRLLQ